MKKGFTLAEVLVTLGIIGTIAVLTIPSIMNDYRNKLYTTQLKKVYVDVSNAVEMVKSEENTDKFYETKAFSTTSTATSGSMYFLSNYIKNVRGYACTAINNCTRNMNIVYENMNGTKLNNKGLYGQYCVQTKSGAIICAGYTSASNHPTLADQSIVLSVDVNGSSAPNVTGRDVFSMRIDSNGNIVDAPSDTCGTAGAAVALNASSGINNSVNPHASGCLTNIIENNWQMEY